MGVYITVFPAHAGMFPKRTVICLRCRSFPRARGDVPPGYDPRPRCHAFSPRTRGCSAPGRCWYLAVTVFPAHAGMFLKSYGTSGGRRSFPRARGDVPASRVCQISMGSFSPRTRGCSVLFRHPESSLPVFPAHAGMFLAEKLRHADIQGFPRARGDVPFLIEAQAYVTEFSPRTRGCSCCWWAWRP